jgi:transcriptional regulator of acetoin/glycerol metabolism
MRGRSSTGYRRTPKVVEIEAEFDMLFPDVLRGFAADGLNRTQTAAVLEYDRATFYRKLSSMERAGVVIDWPCPYASRQTAEYPRTPAQRAASLRNLTKRNVETIKHWGKERKVNATLIENAAALRKKRLPWSTIAFQLGVNITTLFRARRKFDMADPVGNELARKAQKDYADRFRYEK